MLQWLDYLPFHWNGSTCTSGNRRTIGVHSYLLPPKGNPMTEECFGLKFRSFVYLGEFVVPVLMRLLIKWCNLLSDCDRNYCSEISM